MKLLRETIARMILQEGMATMEDLPDDAYVSIKMLSGGMVAVQYVKLLPNGKTKERISYDSNDTCWGVVMIQKSMHQKGLWKVIQTGAGDGWGPLLYDIAMEYATDGGQGLVSDRYDVSVGDDGAQNVWNYYMKHRDGVDVKAHQMDDLYNTLTDTPKDNIPQDIAKQVADDDWPNSALSKRYTKEPTILNKYSDRIIYE